MTSLLSAVTKFGDGVGVVDRVVGTVADRMFPNLNAAADLDCCGNQCALFGGNFYFCYLQCGGCDCGCGPCLGAGGYNGYWACTQGQCSTRVVCKSWAGYCCF